MNTLCEQRNAVNLLLLRKMTDIEQQSLLKILIDIESELSALVRDNHTLI